MPDPVPLADLHLSQLFLDATKLSNALDQFDADNPDVGPLLSLRPVEDLGFTTGIVDTEYVLSDGHTRAFVAHLCGAESVTVERDSDREDRSLGVTSYVVSTPTDESGRHASTPSLRAVRRASPDGRPLTCATNSQRRAWARSRNPSRPTRRCRTGLKRNDHRLDF